MRFAATLAAIVIICASSGFTYQISDSNLLSSEITAKTFYKLAMQLAPSEEVNRSKAEQAVILFQAAYQLDKNPDYIAPLINLLRQYSPAIRAISPGSFLPNTFKDRRISK